MPLQEREAPGRTAPIWFEMGPRTRLYQTLGTLLRITPDLGFQIAAKDGRYFLRLDSSPAQIAPGLAWAFPGSATNPAGVDVSLVDLALGLRPIASPTPPPTALLVSGEGLAAIAKVADPKTLSVSTFGRGGAVYALVDPIATLPASLLRRPDVTRLRQATPGVFCECGFEPPFPAEAITRALQPGHLVIFRRRGGNLRVTSVTALPNASAWIRVNRPPIQNARSPAGIVPLRFVASRAERETPIAVLAMSTALNTLKTWVRRAPAPLLEGLSLFTDQRFWLVMASEDAQLPPFGEGLFEIEHSRRRALVPLGLSFAPRLTRAALLDAVGAHSQEIMLVRPDAGGEPAATRIPIQFFIPLVRHLAKEAS